MDAQHLNAREAAARVARTSYDHLLARPSCSTGDIALAEDSLSAAFEEALRRWPDGSVPNNPQGWILAVARNRQRDVWKSAAHRAARPLEHAERVETASSGPGGLDIDAVGDRRWELLLVCAHPAIDPAVRAPLMLQTVLGIVAARIGRIFAVPPAPRGFIRHRATVVLGRMSPPRCGAVREINNPLPAIHSSDLERSQPHSQSPDLSVHCPRPHREHSDP